MAVDFNWYGYGASAGWGLDVMLPQDGNWVWCFRGTAGWELDVVLVWMWCFRRMGIGCGASAGWELDVVLPRDGNWMLCFDLAAFETRDCVAENSSSYLLTNQLNVQRN